MEPIDVEAARRAWAEASQELGIEVDTANAFLHDADEQVEVVALVRGFGAATGTALLGAQHRHASDLAKAQGFFASILSRSYETYDRSFFEDTLNDWQWFGIGDPPDWYTGKPWS